ncbi:MAG: hypothetical protein M1389_14355, partial [Chloroflexi bacterium]|nr:hypothetical protein [Chloroflexota bacterium]
DLKQAVVAVLADFGQRKKPEISGFSGSPERETGFEPATTCLEASFVPKALFGPPSPDLRQPAFVSDRKRLATT